MNSKRFFDYAKERERIRLRKESGLPIPWTHDPILAEFKFCNVFREDDRTTRWFRQHVRQPNRNSVHVIFATICFRWFNRIETGERLIDANLLFDWNGDRARKALKDCHPLVTGAFMVKTPIGVSPKLEGLVQCLDRVWTERNQLYMQWDALSMEHSWRELLRFPYLGRFMAYEVVTDLRHTSALEEARDKNTWANPGPGALRGAGRVEAEDHRLFAGASKNDHLEVLGIMRELLEDSRAEDNWPKIWPRWEMREVEHTLCEFDKYERARLGEGRPKQRYNGGANARH